MAKIKRLADLIRGIPCEVRGNVNIEVKGIAYHSAFVQPGFLFVAIEGFRESGRNYIEEAINRGAVAVATTRMGDVHKSWVTAIQTQFPRRFLAQVANRFYDFPSRKIILIGVTGTNGKTTVCFMLREVCRQMGVEPGFIGTIEYFDGKERRTSNQTTPESLDFAQLLAQMVERGVSVAISEVSSHSLELDRVFDIDFRVGVFTNLSPEHLDFHRTMDNYRKAKMKLFESLSPKAYAVVNFDDRMGRDIPYFTRAQVVSYGTRPDLEPVPDVSGRVVAVRNDGLDCAVRVDKEEVICRLQLIGRYNIGNVLATVAVGKALNWPLAQVVAGLERLTNVPGRLERVANDLGINVFVDYAHTPDALQKVLETVREFTRGRVIVVFGCGGDRDRAKRPLMGRVAVQLADLVVVTSDNPRSEDPGAIILEITGDPMVKGLKEKVVTEVDRRTAIMIALKEARAQDTVVIAGKGHEDYQIIGSERRHFDDREVAKEILAEISRGGG